MTTEPSHSAQYLKATSLLKTQAILAIVFGGLGVMFAIGLVALYILTSESGVEFNQEETIQFFFYLIITPIFLFISHIYLIISGATLLRSPTPKVAKALSIANIVVGALWNLIILIFAVLFVAQSNEYEKGYKVTK